MEAITQAEIHAEIVGKFKNDYISYPFMLDVWLDNPDLDAPCPNCGASAWEVLEVEGHGDVLSKETRDVECWINATCCDMIGDTFDSEYVGWEGIEWSWLINETKVGRMWGEAFGGRKIYYDADDDHGWGSWNVDWDIRTELLGGESQWPAWIKKIVRQPDAKQFINDHHRHNKAPPGWLWAHAIFNGKELIGIVWVGRPVAREIDHKVVCEVNRLCINHNLHPALTWKAQSLGYQVATQEAYRRGYKKIITYTLADDESGMSLRYCRKYGWKKDGPPTRAGKSWNCPSRPRQDVAPTASKQRWACTDLKRAFKR